MKILVTGSSGLVGQALTKFLQKEGHQIVPLRRDRSCQQIPSWDPEANRLQLSGTYDAVVHLAGESVAGRWTKAKKHRILASRVNGTRLLSEGLAQLNPRPHTLICASAIGYYGDQGDEWLTEESSPGSSFLAETTKAWEQAAEPARAAGIRVIHLRFAMVLSAEGGALPKLVTPFRLGLGGRVGTGRQYWSWVVIDDLLAVVRYVLGNQTLSGPVNVASPNPVPNSEFTRALAAVLHRPALIPLPTLAVRFLLGEMGEEMLLASTRVRPAVLINSGFRFAYSDLPDALRQVLGTT